MTLPKNTAEFRKQAPRYIAALIHDFDLTDFQAAGFLGNIGVESRGFTLMQELRPTVKGSKGGLGPVQWTGPRRRAYEAWLKRNNAQPGQFTTDYGFMFRELKGPEKGVLAPLRQAKTVDQATEIVMRKYEHPGVEHPENRKEWGRLALQIWREGQENGGAPPEKATRYEISTAQARLDHLGYKMVGRVDGSYDTLTVAAIAGFQYDAKLPVTGELNEATKKALYADDAPKRVLSERRQTMTPEKLAPESPIVRDASTVKTGGAILAGAGAAPVVVGGLGGILKNFTDAKEYLQPVMDMFDAVPGWAWGLGLIAVAVVFYRQGKRITDARVAMHKVGETA